MFIKWDKWYLPIGCIEILFFHDIFLETDEQVSTFRSLERINLGKSCCSYKLIPFESLLLSCMSLTVVKLSGSHLLNIKQNAQNLGTLQWSFQR